MGRESSEDPSAVTLKRLPFIIVGPSGIGSEQEKLVLSAWRNFDLGDFAFGVTALMSGGRLSPRLMHMRLLPSRPIKDGDQVNLMTLEGTARVDRGLQNDTHIVYLGFPKPLFDSTRRAALVMDVSRKAKFSPLKKGA